MKKNTYICICVYIHTHIYIHTYIWITWLYTWNYYCCCCCRRRHITWVVSNSVRLHTWQPIRLPDPGILQARTLEWVAISLSNAWKWKVKVKSLSRVWHLATPWTAAHQAAPSMGFSRQEYWSGVPLPSPTWNYYNIANQIFFNKINF